MVTSTLKGLDSHKQFVIGWNLVLGFDLIIEIHSGQSAVSMHLYSLALHKFAAESLGTVVIQVKYNLVPSFVQLEGHGAFEGFYTGY